DYYDQGKEIYETTETVVNAISSGNIGSLVSNIQSLLGGLNLQFGSVYTWGGGRANKQGGYNNVGANLAFALQEQLDEYLASLPPEIRAEVERNLRGDYDRRIEYDSNEIDIADYAGGRQTAGAGSATGPDNAVGANLVFARQDMTPAQLSPPRMAGPPMPPGCYWDVETQAWVEYDKSVGAGPPRSDTVGAHRVRPKKEDLTLMQKVARVYKNTRPAGLAKNAAMAAGPPVIDASEKSAKFLGEKISDAAYKTAKTAKKAADKTKESAEYLGKKTGDAAYKTAKTAGKAVKKGAKAAWKGTKKAAKAAKKVAKKAWSGIEKATKETMNNSLNYFENIQDTAHAIKEKPGQSTNILRGLGTSHRSGDIWDKQPKVEYEKGGPAVLYINGMNTPTKTSKEEAMQISRACGDINVARIENETHGYKLSGDAAQALEHEAKAIDITAIRAANAMKKAINDPEIGEVNVVAHSQGSAVFERALSLLTPEERKKVHYQGFGPQKYIDKEYFGLGSARNVKHAKDPVPNISNDLREKLKLQGKSEKWEVIGRKEEDEGYDVDQHDFRKIYLKHMYSPIKYRGKK
ncbi:hypothetical protein KAR34_14040, partial [bacterium]|nr:hypothetical protein [bacterium]